MKNNKKLLTILSIVLIAIVLFLGYKTFLAPKGVEGEKEVIMEIIAEQENIHENFTYHTDYEFLYELMKEKEKEIGAGFEDSSLGIMLTGLMNYSANADNNEYFHILVNGEDAMTGIQEIPLNNQDHYIFELRKW